MRIYPDLPMIRLDGLTQPLLQLFQGFSKLEGVIKEITPASILLQLEQAELNCPGKLKARCESMAQEGLKVELHRQQGVFILKAQPAASQPEPAALAVALDEALLVWISLLPQRRSSQPRPFRAGFSLQKEHLWVLLPWAEQGRLEKPSSCCRLGCATPALVELVSELRENRRGRPCRNRFARSFRWSCRKPHPPQCQGAHCLERQGSPN